MASKEAYLATELDRARGCNLEDINLAAVIEDYFDIYIYIYIYICIYICIYI